MRLTARKRRRLWWTLLLPVMVVGCRAPVLRVEDAIVRPGEKARLAAFVEREPILGLGKDVADVPVVFLVDGQEVGRDRTNDEGSADTKVAVPADTGWYEARATVGAAELRARGHLYCWSDERVIVAVDIDETIARTEYDELLIERDEDGSDPHKRAARTLRALAQDCHILYLTGRPRALLDKTRTWLGEHDFPSGPVLMSERKRDLLRPGNYKEKRLRALRKQWPTLLIGIGNEKTDAEAYGANNMLTLMLADKRPRGFGQHALVFRDWKALGQFLAANRAVLTSPGELKEVIAGKRQLLCALRPYEPE